MEIEIRLDNGVSQVLGTIPKEVENAIDDACHYMEPNFFMMKRAMEAKGRFMSWDGKKHLFNTKTYSFMTGLLSLVCGAISSTGHKFKIDDVRVKPRKVHHLEWKYPYPARPYQLEAVEKGLVATRGVFEIAAGGGKSFVAMKTIQELGVKTLYTVNTRIALKSTMEEAELSFGKRNPLIKRWDTKKREVGELLTVITMASAIKHLDLLKTHAFNMIIADECLDEDTWITIPGGIKKLKDIKIGDTVLTPKGTAKVRNKWVTEKEAYEYQTYKGSLIASDNHLVYSKGKVVPIGEALELTCSRTQEITEEESHNLYGWYVADGTFDSSNLKFAFTKQNKIKIFRDNLLFKFFVNKRGNHVFSFLARAKAKAFIHKYAIEKYKTLHPEIVKSCSPSFLRGMFSGDGYRIQNRIGMGLSRKDLTMSILAMLNGLGIHPSLTYPTLDKNKSNASQRIRLSLTGDNISKFNSQVGWDISDKDKPRRSTNQARIGAKINKVVSKGVRNLVDIELDDEDKLFFANGFVVHNCHHSAADTWKQVITTLKPYYAYGLSGTNFRMDGKDKLLLATTGRSIVKVLTADLINLSFLTPANVTFVDVPAPKGLNMPFQNYAELYTLGIVENEWRNRLASELVRRHLGEPTLLVIDKIAHGEALLEDIQRFYPDAMFLHGKSKKNEEHIQRFIDGELKVIIASKIFNESVNVKNLKVVINASGGKSGIAVLQRIARALRLHDSKDEAVIYDFNDIFNYKLEEHARERIKWLKKDKHNVKEVTVEELGIKI